MNAEYTSMPAMKLSTISSEGNNTIYKLPFNNMKFLRPYSVFKYENIFFNWYCEVGVDRLQKAMDIKADRGRMKNQWILLGEFCNKNCHNTISISTKRNQDDQDTLVRSLVLTLL